MVSDSCSEARYRVLAVWCSKRREWPCRQRCNASRRLHRRSQTLVPRRRCRFVSAYTSKRSEELLSKTSLTNRHHLALRRG